MKKAFLPAILMALALTLSAGITRAAEEPVALPQPEAPITQLTYHGHSAFEIVTPKGQVLMIDPWLRNPVNPAAKGGKDPVAGVKNLDYILVTHGHYDHVGDASELSKKTGARLVASFELGGTMAHLLSFPQVHMRYNNLMNIGGEITIADGEVTVAMTQAIHSSSVQDPNAGKRNSLYVYAGTPCGFVIRVKDGPTIYHAGDTAYFRDMETIGRQYAPDVALLPMGGHFVMEPAMAAEAAATLQTKLAIPMHYGTYPVLEQKATPFLEALAAKNIPGLAVEPGRTILFAGKVLQQ